MCTEMINLQPHERNQRSRNHGGKGIRTLVRYLGEVAGINGEHQADRWTAIYIDGTLIVVQKGAGDDETTAPPTLVACALAPRELLADVGWSAREQQESADSPPARLPHSASRPR